MGVPIACVCDVYASAQFHCALYMHEPFHPGICTFGLWTLINCTVNYDHVTSIINLCNHAYDKYGYIMRTESVELCAE